MRCRRVRVVHATPVHTPFHYIHHPSSTHAPMSNTPVAYTPDTEVCTKAGCTSKVVVALCRGIKNPENRGYFYERCAAPGPYSHWLKWRREINRLTEEEMGSSAYHTPIPTTIQEALQFPCTPSNIPLSPSTPTRSDRHHHVASSPLKPPVPKTPQALISQPTSGFPGLGQTLGNQPVALPPAPVVDGTSTVMYSHPATRTVIIKGKPTVVCNGPICRDNGKAVRIAQPCINRFCLKCCLHFQSLGGPKCKMPTHHPQAKQARAQTDTPSVP